MSQFGIHASIQGGIEKALYRAYDLGANTVQIFTQSPRQRKGRNITQDDVIRWFEARDKTGLKNICTHGSYLINIASPDESTHSSSMLALNNEIERCIQLDIKRLNIHPGAYTRSNPQVALDKIVDSINQLTFFDNKLTLVLETTAGSGTQLGKTFKELGYIIDNCPDRNLGICIDTCHIFAAGYDISKEDGLITLLEEFQQYISLDKLSMFHLNDSIHTCRSFKDRHANIGNGYIGNAFFKSLCENARLKHIPMYLETPNGDTMWKNEIKNLFKWSVNE
ncbi:deoxyribonuclease IV [Chlamydiia bacterium]|jgi:deoxyribonuclease IV|nr:deoxyribonuclease IV [Chlamydiia bacterium]